MLVQNSGDNNNYEVEPGAVTDIPTNQTWDATGFDCLTLTNAGLVGVGSNAALNLTGVTLRHDETKSKEGFYLHGGGTLAGLPSPFAFSYRVWLEAGSRFDPGSVTVLSNGILQVDGSNSFSGNLAIRRGALLTHSPTPKIDWESYKVMLGVGGSLTIEEGARVAVNDRGFKPQKGIYKASQWWMGASHGGLGGSASAITNSDCPTYGSIFFPTNIGSAVNYQNQTTNGGGAILLFVTGACTNNGLITANGGKERGAGSGGSIYLRTATLAGNGTIQADGGNSTGSTGGAGGGGRIAVVLTSGLDFDRVDIHAYGGNYDADGIPGGAGTLYLQTAGQGNGSGRILVNNANKLKKAQETWIPALTNAPTNEVEFASLILTNTSRAVLSRNVNLSDLYVYTNSFLRLTNWIVRVGVPEHRLDGPQPGPGSTNRVDHYDQILWAEAAKVGTLILLR